MIPSAYGVLIWTLLLLAGNLGLVTVHISSLAFLIFLYTTACFGLSSFIMYGLFKSIDIKGIGTAVSFTKFDKIVFFGVTVLGFAGLFIYVRDFSSFLGGFTSFFLAFWNEPLLIRALASEESSIGFQLSYFSWLSIFYCILILARDKNLFARSKIIIYSILILQFFLNLMFIDRTRPVILFLSGFLIYLVLRARSFKNPLKYVFYVFAGPLIIFFVQAIFTEKYDKDEGLIANFLVYVFGGFGYFSAAINDVNPDYSLVRTFYPLAKVLNAMGWSFDIPSQVLDFKQVPFPTNVGTFLEPLLADGGLLYIFFGTPIVIFLLDIASYISLQSKTALGIFVWSSLVLVSIFSFFVPKYNAAYIYLFLAIFFLMSIFSRRTFKKYVRAYV